MNHSAKLILVLTSVLLGSVCHAAARSVQDVTSTSAKLVMREPPDCGSGAYMHFEYAPSTAALEAGSGQATAEVHIGQNASGCGDASPGIDLDVRGLSPDTTYYYRQCGRGKTARVNTCTSARQFTTRETAGSMQRIRARDGDLYRKGERFHVFGVQNLDHDFERSFYTRGSPADRAKMTDKVKAARTLGANTMRIHLQLFDFIGRDTNGRLFVRQASFDNLAFLLHAAEREGLYLLVSGNNVWFEGAAPKWYDEMPYRERWEVQAFFFEQLAAAGASSPNILAYELMSEPTLRLDDDADWYTGELGGYRFAQVIARGISRDQAAQVARDWINRLTSAIREHDADHLITFGALGRFYGGALGIQNTAPLLDFLSPHIYPDQGDPEFAIRSARRFALSGKPVVIGETHLFRSNARMFREFVIASAPLVDGYISFFNGVSPDDMIIDASDPHALELTVHRQNLETLQNLRAVILDK